MKKICYNIYIKNVKNYIRVAQFGRALDLAQIRIKGIRALCEIGVQDRYLGRSRGCGFKSRRGYYRVCSVMVTYRIWDAGSQFESDIFYWHRNLPIGFKLCL